MPSYPYALTIVNPGAESGVNGWTNVVGTLQQRASGADVASHSGSFYFCSSPNTATSECYQDIAIPNDAEADVDAGLLKATFEAWHAGFTDTDTGQMRIAFRTAGGSTLLTVNSEAWDGTSTWVQRTLAAWVPPTTRTVRITLIGTRTTGTQLSSYWDDLTLSLTQPTTGSASFFGVTGFDLVLDGADLTGAADDPISAWADQSGLGNDVTGSGATRPLYKPTGTTSLDGKPTAYGDRVNDILTNPSACDYAGSTGLTIIAVVEQIDPGAADGAIVGRDTSSSRGWECGIRLDGRAFFIISTASSPSTARVRRDGSSIDLRRTPAVLRFRYDGLIGEQSIWVNGVNDNGAIDGSVPAYIGGQGPSLSVFNTGFSNPLGGHIAKLFVAGRALTDQECSDIEEGLKTEYDLVTLTQVSKTNMEGSYRQGVAHDGTYGYLTDTTHLARFNPSDWSILATNGTPYSGLANVDHIGDPVAYNGKLYVPMEDFDLTSASDQYIGIFNATTLARESATNISAQGHECASIAIDSANNLLFIASWLDGTQLFKYNLTTLAYIGAITLSETIERIQGISYDQTSGLIWVACGANSSNSINDGRILTVDPATGTVRARYRKWRDPALTNIEAEGIDVTQGALYWVWDEGTNLEYVYKFSVSSFASSPVITAVAGAVGVIQVSGTEPAPGETLELWASLDDADLPESGPVGGAVLVADPWDGSQQEHEVDPGSTWYFRAYGSGGAGGDSYSNLANATALAITADGSKTSTGLVLRDRFDRETLVDVDHPWTVNGSVSIVGGAMRLNGAGALATVIPTGHTVKGMVIESQIKRVTEAPYSAVDYKGLYGWIGLTNPLTTYSRTKYLKNQPGFADRYQLELHSQRDSGGTTQYGTAGGAGDLSITTGGWYDFMIGLRADYYTSHIAPDWWLSFHRDFIGNGMNSHNGGQIPTADTEYGYSSGGDVWDVDEFRAYRGRHVYVSLQVNGAHPAKTDTMNEDLKIKIIDINGNDVVDSSQHPRFTGGAGYLDGTFDWPVMIQDGLRIPYEGFVRIEFWDGATKRAEVVPVDGVWGGDEYSFTYNYGSEDPDPPPPDPEGPETPTLKIGTLTDDSVVLDGSVFAAGTGGGTHVSRQYQVRKFSDADWSTPIYDNTDLVNLEDVTAAIDFDTLAPGEVDFLARIKDKDSNDLFSEWSCEVGFSRAQSYGTNFTEYAAGANLELNGWLESINYGATSTFTVKNNAKAACGRAVERRSGSSSDTSLDPLHRLSLGRFPRDQKVLVSGMNLSASGYGMGAAMRVQDSAEDSLNNRQCGEDWRVDHYACFMYNGTHIRVERGYGTAGAAPTPQLRAEVPFPYIANKRYFIEAECITNIDDTVTIRCKVWDATKVKPSEWTCTLLDDTENPLINGAPAFMGRGNTKQDFDVFAAATEGLALPSVQICNLAKLSAGLIKVEDSEGNWIELTDLGGKNWVLQADWEENIDNPSATANVEAFLATDAAAESLSPMIEGSVYNLNSEDVYAPLIQPGRGLRIWMINDDNLGYTMVFDGYQDTVEFGEKLRIECRDKFSYLMDSMIEVPTEYAAMAMHTLLQTLLDDNLGDDAPTIYTETGTDLDPIDLGEVPTGLTSPYTQEQMSLGEQLRAIAQQVGWDVRYRRNWENPDQAHRLVFFAPARDKTVVDKTFAPDQYYNIRSMILSRVDVRNVCRVFYFTNPETTVPNMVTSIDEASIAKYGRRFMQIVLDQNSQINTHEEAILMAEAAVKDLGEPIMQKEVELPLYWQAQLGDLYTFEANYVNYDTDQKLAPVAIRHSMKYDNVRTTLTCRGNVAGAYRDWLNWEDRKYTETDVNTVIFTAAYAGYVVNDKNLLKVTCNNVPADANTYQYSVERTMTDHNGNIISTHTFGGDAVNGDVILNDIDPNYMPIDYAWNDPAMLTCNFNWHVKMIKNNDPDLVVGTASTWSVFIYMKERP